MNSGEKEQQAKQETTRKPGRDDVHEQREDGQQQEGAIQAPAAPPQPESGTTTKT